MTLDKRLSLLVFAGLLALLAFLYFAARPVNAAPRQDTRCWFADGYLYAEGLPTTYPYSITTEPIPTGTTSWSVDGTLSFPTNAETIYIWVRGHGPSLIKAGNQKQDYHVIAYCEVPA